MKIFWKNKNVHLSFIICFFTDISIFLNSLYLKPAKLTDKQKRFCKCSNQCPHQLKYINKVENTNRFRKDIMQGFQHNAWFLRRFLRIWSHLLKKSLMENFIFCAVFVRFWSRSNSQIISLNIVHFCWLKKVFITWQTTITVTAITVTITVVLQLPTFLIYQLYFNES